ncbi:polysaccharide deacetylase family protein [Streptomyces lancefieldiae]|uniref:Polysaccharide deacetylase family protein n=1 Tax=Streptomyces lancefieldiae TaxID=3075520 RepID=A0ABU3AUW5_9ACTN|nr:polysaccharide deacetylase family protein [Streptomyces sp. DSM 40712]MDT0612898.1 polysaccharide deacetylase family protein [Streptomyces sp. DSM 40712]
MNGHRPSLFRPGRRPLLRAVLALLALAVPALAFTTAWQYDSYRRAVAHQAAPPAPSSGAPVRGAGASPAREAPVVLAYHDVGPETNSHYTVSPQRFDAHLRALREAGYRTLTTGEFTEFLRTGRTPAPRSVYLTFDDGTHGLWVHADPILARHRMKAAAYLITGQVGTHRPYYLSWAEIERMARSGRWDFQAHTDRSHVRSVVDATGRKAPVLTNRLWLEGERRLESEREYRLRVEADLDRSIDAFARRGLPRPELFAYPFSETRQGTNLGPNGFGALRTMLRERFTAALTNSSSRPLPPGRRAAAAGEVQRLEVTRDTTSTALLRELARWTPVAPADVHRPLERPDDWRFPKSAEEIGIGALTGEDPHPRRTYVWADHRPIATADWTTYRVRATVTGLRGPATGAGLTVRVGSEHPAFVSLGRGTARLGERGTKGKRCELDPSGTHELRVSVTPEEVRVSVDGRLCGKLRSHWRTDAHGAGGFSLNVRNEDGSGPWPRFTSLTVK